MSPKSVPPPSQREPAGLPPSSPNKKYAIIVLLMLIGCVAVVVLKMRGATPPPAPVAPVSTFDAAPVSHSDDVVPPPPPSDEPSATASAPTAGPTHGGTYDACPKTCNGSASPELEQQLAFRARASHRCYDQALTQNGDLQGHLTVKVKVGTNGSVCGASIVSNDMGSDSVASCVANTFRSTAAFAAPKGGCVEVQVPISFSPGGK
jgi:outer membrane biosynthesis protein TonB